MREHATHTRFLSALGDHLVAVLVIATVVLALLTAYPALATQARGTAAKAQQRVNQPVIVASYLDDEPQAPARP